MPTSIDRVRVLELLEHEQAQLVEVLPRDEYDEEHLVGAIHLPLKSLDATSIHVLDPERPVIVYCWDCLCDMSPRAAWRLERFGFDVYDYAAGKVDWLAAGLATVRAVPGPRRALDAADRAPRTCAPDTPVAHLGIDAAIVVNEQGIVLGRVRSGDQADGAAKAEDVMESGPATVRAHEPLDDLLERMDRRHVSEMIVTTPEGRLLGAVHEP
jgi:rhodanese-related sulfurtransferase